MARRPSCAKPSAVFECTRAKGVVAHTGRGKKGRRVSPTQRWMRGPTWPRRRVAAVFACLVVSVSVGLLLAPIAGADVPDNDEYQFRFDETLGFPEFQSTTEATADGEPMTPGDAFGCPNNFDGQVHQMGATVWYRVKGTGRDIKLSATGFDTMMTVYATDGSDPPVDDNIIYCSDDVAEDDASSQITFPSDQGSRYLVQVGGCCDATPDSGNLTFLATSPPPNDARAAATP